MPLSYRSTGRSRERILSFGGEGSGKTTDIFTVARAIPDVTFHWIDNDNSFDRIQETEFPDVLVRWEDGVEVADEGNVSLWTPETWDEHMDPFVAVFGDKQGGVKPGAGDFPAVGRDDWIVVDSASLPWDAVQDWYSEELFDKARDELIREKREARMGTGKKNLIVFEGDLDWAVINPVYRRYFGKHLLRPPCHLYITADMAPLDDRDSDKQNKTLYGKHGVKPRGQKRLGQSVQTVLLKERTKGADIKITSIKDRGRGMFEVATKMDDFMQEYMVNVAGWKRQVVKAGE